LTLRVRIDYESQP